MVTNSGLKDFLILLLGGEWPASHRQVLGGEVTFEQCFGFGWLCFLTLEVVSRWSWNCLKFSVLATKYPCVVFFPENNSLGELRHPRFTGCLEIDGVCYRFVIIRVGKGGYVWRRLWAGILWRNVPGSDTGKTGSGDGVSSNRCNNWLNPSATNCTTFWNQNLRCLTNTYFYIKMMKRKTLQACSLNHSIKKSNLFKLGRAESSC